MKGRSFFSALRRLLLALGTVGLVANADEDSGPAASTAACDAYPQVTCTSTNPALVSDVLQLANDTRDELGPLLQLGPTWRYAVHIRVVTPVDPLAGSFRDKSSAALIDGATLKLEAAVSSTDPEAREFVQRQFVTALLWEKYFQPGQAITEAAPLEVAPLWLNEGLREWLSDDPEHNREAVVRRAAQNDRAPSLQEVTSWKTLSGDRLLGLWQRAFSYYLVNSLVRQGPQRDQFQQWLATVAGPNPGSAILLFPTERGWRYELTQATGRSRDLVYNWEETVAQLAALETIPLPSTTASTADARICTLDHIDEFTIDPKYTAVLNKKSFDLAALELRAHASWRPILALYRFGLNDLVANRTDEARQFFTQAREERTQEMAYHQKLVDYLNWFEVTKDFAGISSRFNSYFSTAHELERAEADPGHPNPIRAALLKTESQL